MTKECKTEGKIKEEGRRKYENSDEGSEKESKGLNECKA